MDKTLVHTFQLQINGYYCGPAATRVALSCKNVFLTQDQLASQLGTTVNGTNSSNDVVRVLNAHLGGNTYSAVFIPGNDATLEQRAALRWSAVASINNGLAVVANVVGTVRPIGGGSYSYPGGHYVTVVGYQADGERFLVADVNTREYWVTVEALATWIAARGYSVGKAAVVEPPKPTTPAPPVSEDSLYIIDLASYQEGINLEAAKNDGVQAVNIKTSEGTGYTWLRAKEYAEYARRIGLQISTFHWLDSSGSGVVQAQRAYQLMKELGNGSTDGMAHACDCEDDASETIFTEYVTEFQRLLGRPIALYTGDWWWTPRGWVGADNTPYLWAAPNDGYLASYPGDDSSHWIAGYGGWANLSALQFAVQPIAGFSGNVSKTMIRQSAWSVLTGNSSEGDDMALALVYTTDNKIYLSNFIERRTVPNTFLNEQKWVDHLKWHLTNTGVKFTEYFNYKPDALDGIFGALVEGEPVVVPPTPPTSTNIAFGKVTSSSAPAVPTEGPAKAVNGVISGLDSKFCTTAPVKYLQVDLGGLATVTGYKIYHAGAGGETPLWNTKDFNVRVSTDGVTWTTVSEIRGNTSSVTDVTLPTKATDVRYVKLDILVPTSSIDVAARIYEFEVYGFLA